MGCSAKVIGSVRSDTTIYRPRVRQSPRRIALRRAVFLAAVLAAVLILVGLAFAGSETELASGTTISGVDVGGMSEAEAARVLSSRAEALKSTPVTFTADGEPFALTASQLGVEPDWRAAVATAAAEGGGFGRSAASGACERGSSVSACRRPSSPTTPPFATSSPRSPAESTGRESMQRSFARGSTFASSRA